MCSPCMCSQGQTTERNWKGTVQFKLHKDKQSGEFFILFFKGIQTWIKKEKK